MRTAPVIKNIIVFVLLVAREIDFVPGFVPSLWSITNFGKI
jgi:hypothetical protein